jgi:excisionase family DNA binding protein
MESRAMLKVKQPTLRSSYFNTTETLLTVREASQLLHVHENTLRHWGEKGVIKAYRIGPRGDRRFKSEDIATLVFGEGTEDD